MNYLIFRTDRIGDFLMTSSLLSAIKRNDDNSKIYIVASKKNADFIKKSYLVDKVFSLESNKLIDRFKLYIQLKNYKFDNIIISDKKNRSILLALLLKSKNKLFNVSKEFQKKLLSIFYKNILIDNDKIKDLSLSDVLKNNCKSLGLNFKDEDFHYLKLDQFKKQFLHGDLIDLENLEFLIFHYDEKWEIENYAKTYKKASNLTDISMNLDFFLGFLSQLADKTKKKIFLSTGSVNTSMIEKIKVNAVKINECLYEISLKNNKAYLLINEDFFSMSHLISKSSMFISCHGAFTHVASNYKIKILDIIEKDKIFHYSKITKHMKNYKCLFRDNFNLLSKDIIKNS
tara:strand:+ start:1009 stop:2040 length:1032 start_codon:yes stop_codon:yes gene_type:complete